MNGRLTRRDGSGVGGALRPARKLRAALADVPTHEVAESGRAVGGGLGAGCCVAEARPQVVVNADGLPGGAFGRHQNSLGVMTDNRVQSGCGVMTPIAKVGVMTPEPVFGQGSPGHDTCHHLRFRLSCDDFAALLQRCQNRCEICGIPGPEAPRGKLYLDHDHRYGLYAIRGLLCARCNRQNSRSTPPPRAVQRPTGTTRTEGPPAS